MELLEEVERSKVLDELTDEVVLNLAFSVLDDDVDNEELDETLLRELELSELVKRSVLLDSVDVDDDEEELLLRNHVEEL